MSRYGYFSEDGREYVITRPDTPRPWINYLSNEKFCALCSHTGGGYSFYETSGYNRITNEFPPFVIFRDQPGRFVYLRDNETGQFWNINWQPVAKEGMRWESRHGMGYTWISSEWGGIAGEITYYVPRNDDTEVWLIRIRNESDTPRSISSFSFVEWSLANYAFNLTEAAFSDLFNEATFENDILFVTKRFWNLAPAGGGNPNIRWDKFAFLTSNPGPDAFDSIGEEFMGLYRGWDRPAAVERGRCSNSIGHGRHMVGALQHDLELAPGEEKRLTVLLGVTSRKEDVYRLRERYDEWEEAQIPLRELGRYWNDYLSRNTCDTPDRDFDVSFNVWNKYQAWITSRWSRMDSYYIGGASIVGFRDSWQDMLGVLPNDLEWARQRTFYMLEHQFPDGSTLHNWDPLTNIGVKTGHSDDPLWLVLGIVEYIKESGDLQILDEPAAYYDGGVDTVRQHLIQALDYSLSRMSIRRIPLREAADWNDGLDQVGRQGRGESTMVAEHLAWMLREASALLLRTGHPDLAERYSQARDEIISATNSYLWDGEWYARGTRDDGQVFGSHRNEEGRIYLNAQSWAVISGLAGDGRAEACMDAVDRHLDTEYGPALFLPAYSEPNPRLGIISRFAPGTKENGTIFNHPVSWTIMALCILGRVYAEYVHGPDSVTFGQGEFTWMTGTAAWMWKVCLEWILGVRPEIDGLRIDPCIPREWDSFRVRRQFRNAEYEFRVENPDGVCKGVASVSVDGEDLADNLVPAFRDGRAHEVAVRMGVPAGRPEAVAALREHSAS